MHTGRNGVMVVRTVGWSSAAFRQLPLRLSSPSHCSHCSPLRSETPDKPHRRTALVALELARYNIDIAALSETRLHGEDSLTEVGAGYTFFWKGVPEGARHNHGVGFAVKSKLLQCIPESPIGINERPMTWRIPLGMRPLWQRNASPPSSVHMHQRLMPSITSKRISIALLMRSYRKQRLRRGSYSWEISMLEWVRSTWFGVKLLASMEWRK